MVSKWTTLLWSESQHLCDCCYSWEQKSSKCHQNRLLLCNYIGRKTVNHCNRALLQMGRHANYEPYLHNVNQTTSTGRQHTSMLIDSGHWCGVRRSYRMTSSSSSTSSMVTPRLATKNPTNKVLCLVDHRTCSFTRKQATFDPIMHFYTGWLFGVGGPKIFSAPQEPYAMAERRPRRVAYARKKMSFSAAHRLRRLVAFIWTLWLYHNSSLLSCSPYLTDEENQSLYGKCYHIHGHGHNYTGKCFTVPILKVLKSKGWWDRHMYYVFYSGGHTVPCILWHFLIRGAGFLLDQAV